MSEIADARDHEWLAARERGEDVSHVPAARRAPYDELGALLQKLPGMTPGDGWKQRVLGEIDALEAREPPRRAAPPARWRRWAAAGAAVAAAAAIAIYLARPDAPRFGDQPVVTTELRSGPGVVRGRGAAEASLHDTLVVRIEATGPVEVRVYGDTDEVLKSCGEHGGCTVERDGERRRLVLELPLDAPGAVRVVTFAGARIPPSTGARPTDLDAAIEAGITPIYEPVIVVR